MSFNAIFILLEKYFVNGHSKYMRFKCSYMGLFHAFLMHVRTSCFRGSSGAIMEFNVSVSICPACWGTTGKYSWALVWTSGEGADFPTMLLSLGELGKASKVRFLKSGSYTSKLLMGLCFHFIISFFFFRPAFFFSIGFGSLSEK